MILSYGTETVEQAREKHLRYRFFDDPDQHGEDAVFGLDGTLAALVNAFKSAAKGYGIEKRVLLLHGPVGSSKSTIARLIKKGLERYSGADEGALFTLGWVDLQDADEHPLVPDARRAVAPDSAPFPADVVSKLNAGRRPDDYHARIMGELCPFCRYVYSERLRHYNGDWTRVVEDVPREAAAC